jgi:hypothetical protein
MRANSPCACRFCFLLILKEELLLKLIDKQTALSYFDVPMNCIELEAWCRENGYSGVDPTRDIPNESYPSDYVLASALWWAQNRYPDANNLDICSFAGLVAYLATGWYGGFGTDQYEKERRAENIVLSLAGGTQTAEPYFYVVPVSVVNGTPTADFTRRVLEFLDTFYFIDERRAITELMAKNALDLVRAGELLTPPQVAKMYGITPRAVQMAAKDGKLTPDEYTETTSGYLITRAGAKRLWGGKEG